MEGSLANPPHPLHFTWHSVLTTAEPLSPAVPHRSAIRLGSFTCRTRVAAIQLPARPSACTPAAAIAPGLLRAWPGGMADPGRAVAAAPSKRSPGACQPP